MTMSRELNGRKILLIFAGFFGVIITVNLILAYNAVKTFPGLEVKNSYVASQSFDARRTAQENLGWDVDLAYKDGEVVLEFLTKEGAPVMVGDLDILIGRKTTVRDDLTPQFAFDGDAYVAKADLAPGFWTVRISAMSEEGVTFEQRRELYVKD